MGESSLILEPDNHVFDVDFEFPQSVKTVALSMSGGVESTLLLKFLIERYGAQNVRVVTGAFKGRRSWEATRTAATARRLGVSMIHVVPQTNEFMTAQTNYQMYLDMKSLYGFDGWFNGTNAKLFSPSNVTSEETVRRLRSDNHFLPFVFLKKYHTVGLYYLKGWEEDLYSSFSCTERGDIHCGKCYCCHERVRGFATIGKVDHAEYAIPWDDILDECFYSDANLVS